MPRLVTGWPTAHCHPRPGRWQAIAGGRTNDAVIATGMPKREGTTILASNLAHVSLPPLAGADVCVPGQVR